VRKKEKEKKKKRKEEREERRGHAESDSQPRGLRPRDRRDEVCKSQVVGDKLNKR
jgi:ubiquitin